MRGEWERGRERVDAQVCVCGCVRDSLTCMPHDDVDWRLLGAVRRVFNARQVEDGAGALVGVVVAFSNALRGG